MIKGYTIVKRIEETNTSIVYKVRLKASTFRILKIARQNINEHNDLIKREFQILKKISHPHIVDVMDMDTDEKGRFFFIQSFVPGKPIDRCFNSLNPDLAHALIQTTHALAALHNKGFIHGDIKPDHLLYDKRKKNVVLIDFGYARMPDDISIRTGTLGYIAPEVLKGTGLDQRSDIFSLGVIAYELIAGQPAETQWQDIPGITHKMNTLLRRMRSHEPALRPSVLEIYEVLSEYGPETQIQPSYTVDLPLTAYVERKNIMDTLLPGVDKAYTITGEAGAGKTRLLLELKYLFVQTGYSTVYHMANERITLLEVLRRYLHLERVETTSTQDKYAIFQNIYQQLKQLADTHPVVLLIDDAEMLSAYDHALLRYIGFGLQNSNVQVVCTSSKVAIADKLNFETLHLEPLSAEETQQLVSNTLYRLDAPDKGPNVTQRFSQWLHKHSGGNPLYIVEILNTLFNKGILIYTIHGWHIDITALNRAHIPEGLEYLLIKRFEHFDTSAQTILHALALIETPIEPEILHTAFNQVNYASIEHLKNHGFIREETVNNARVIFIPNQIIRHMIHSKLTKRDQTVYQKKIISTLETETTTAQYIPLLAILSDRVGNKRKAIQYAQQAAQHAERIYDHESAINFYRIILRNTPKQKRDYIANELKIAELLTTTGKTQEALELYQALINRAPKNLHARIHADTGRAYCHMGYYEKAIDALQESLVLLRNQDTSLVLDVQTRLAYCLTVTHQFDKARPYIDQTLKTAEEQKEFGLLSTALYNKAAFEQQQGNTENSIQCALTHINFCNQHGFWRDEAFSALLLSSIHHNQHDCDQALTYVDHAITSLQKSGDTTPLLSAFEKKASLFLDKGQVDQAYLLFQSTLTSAEQIHYVPVITRCCSTLSMINIMKGNFEAAMKKIHQGLTYQSENISLLTDLIEIVLAKNDIKEAVLIQKKIKKTGDDLYYYRTALRIAVSENDVSQVRTYIKHIERISTSMKFNHSQMIDIHYEYLTSYYCIEEYSKAMQHAKKIMEITSDSDIRHIIARVYTKLISFHVDGAEPDLSPEMAILQKESLLYEIVILQRLRLEAIVHTRQTRISSWSLGQDLIKSMEIAESIKAPQEVARLLQLQQVLFSRIIEAEPQHPVSTNYLEVFSKIAVMIERHLGDEDFLKHLLDIVIQATDAERGALFMQTSQGLEFIIGRDMDQTTLNDAHNLSKTAIRELDKKQIIFSENALSDPDFNVKKSVILNKIRSLLCIPLNVDDNVVGALYLDSRFQERTFSPQDTDFLTAVARILAAVIDKSTIIQKVIEENKDLRRTIITDIGQGYLISNSKPMKRVYTLIDQVAETNAPVLLVGETGTGKGMLARLIHQKSLRKDRKFTVINCGTIPETLLESELFGHKKGSFTGAYIDKAGLLEQAQGGTVFLDEITNTSPAFQAKLLEAIEDKVIRRVGETNTRIIDVRFIFATNKDLEIEVEDGRFRKDLYYRIHVFKITIPPLRDRTSDIKVLAQFFLEKSSKDIAKNVIGFTPEAMKILHSYHWAGNVRELRHVIERAVVLARSSNITHHELNLDTHPGSKAGTLRELKKDAVIEALEATNYNISQAAKLLRVSRRTIQRYRKKYHF